MNRNLEHYMSDSGFTPDLGRIQQGIQEEQNVLPASLESIRSSYEEGLAMVLAEGENAVGYVRMEPLLTESLRNSLGLQNLPLIWELGTVFLDRQYRGQGLYRGFNNAFLERFRERIIRDELLIIGTTKTPKYLSVLEHAREVGVEFQTCQHNEYPMVAAFTCICKGEFGQGFQLTDSCPSRADLNFLPTALDREQRRSLGEVMSCVMFVSSSNLAQRTDEALVTNLGSRNRLVGALIMSKYYS